MQAIKSPLNLGQTGSEVTNLQEILIAFISQGIIQVSDENMVNRLADEYSHMLFGGATAEIIRAYQIQYGLNSASNPFVDESTRISLNNMLQQQPEQMGKVLRGNVRSANGTPGANLSVRVDRANLNGTELIGYSGTDENGSYEFSFDNGVPDSGKKTGYEVSVTDNAGVTHSSGVIYLSGDQLNVDVEIPDTGSDLSEYEHIYNALSAILGATPLWTISESDDTKIEFLSAQTEERRENIVAMVKAAHIAHTIGAAGYEAVIYGLLRQNIDTTPSRLAGVGTGILKRALVVATTNNLIPGMNEGQIDDAISILNQQSVRYILAYNDGVNAENAFFRIIQYVVNESEAVTSFIEYYVASSFVADDAFWTKIAGDDRLGGYLQLLKAALSYTLLTGSNPALVHKLLTFYPDSTATAALSKGEWVDIIQQAKNEEAFFFIFPSYVTGNNDNERIQNYALHLSAHTEAMHPTHAIAARVNDDGGASFPALKDSLQEFMNRNSQFDINNTMVHEMTEDNGFSFEGVADRDHFVSEVGKVQRLLYLSSSYDNIAVISDKGFSSSLQIAMQSEEDFSAAIGGNIPDEQLAQVYSTARSVSAYSTAALFSMYANAAITGSAGAASGGAAASNPNTSAVAVKGGWINGIFFDPTQTYAEWRTLFGQLDGCNCCQCQSVYSPSAYLTDLLHFLKVGVTGSPVHDVLLFYRRPDIKDIELTCKNANTPVPQIDLINELLEDLVSSASAGYVSSKGTYMTYARQTVADAATQRAVPEYVNTNGSTVKYWDNSSSSYLSQTLPSPYPLLKNAIYPWSLPYNFYKRQIDTHLDISGVKGHELIQRFGPHNKLEAWNDYSFCYEYLRTSQQEADIITIAPAATITDLAPVYGFKYNSSTVTVGRISDPAKRGAYLNVAAGSWISGTLGFRIDIFLQQTGLTYSELLQLLDCYSINPFVSAGVRKLSILKNDPKWADDTCSLDQLMINNLDAGVLTILHRFVRMKRLLGWSYYELDKAMLALGVTTVNASVPADVNQATFNELARLKYLSEAFKLSVEEVLILFSDIDTLAYRDYKGNEPKDIPNMYLRIFRNPAAADINASNYPFPANPSTATPIAVDILTKYLSGILNIPASELQKVFDDRNIVNPTAPGISFLSSLYREAIFLRGLGMSVSDWIILKKWLGTSTYFGSAGDNAYSSFVNFNALDTNAVVRLYTLVRELADAGVSPADIDYLLEDKMPDTVADDELNTKLETSLTNLRTGLNKLWSPGYNPSSDTDGSQLQQLLKRVMDEDKASRLVSIVQMIATAAPDYNATEAANLVNTELAFLNLTATTAHNLLNTTLTTSGPNQNNPYTRRVFVFEQLDEYMKATQLRPYVVTYFAKEYKLAESTMLRLLRDCIKLNGDCALDALVDAAFISDNTDIVRWYTGSSVPASVVPLQHTLLLQKAVMLTHILQLGEEDINYFWVKQNILKDVLQLSDLPIRTTQVVSSSAPIVPAVFSKLANTLRWIKVRSFIGEKTSALYQQLDSFVTSPATTSKTVFTDLIAAVFKTAKADMTTLLGGTGATGTLQATFTTGSSPVVAGTAYRLPCLYMRVIDTLEMQHLLPSTMATLSNMSTHIQVAANQNDANVVVQVVKGQYTDKAWLETVRPVNDLLRTERRDALVAYLLANPVIGYEYKWHTSADIFETLMVDVDMMSCMATTRVLLAVNSVQLWVDRVSLGLEKDVVNSTSSSATMLKMDKTSTRQWQTWRKRYRIWEANRKIFVYPENWIEPELRDDKSPIFLELEKYLKQNEVTDENVETAYRTYLDRLDEVAHLDIVGMYRETSQQNYGDFDYDSDITKRDTIHVFGRTPAHPHIYYYRKRVAEVWTHWEKMDVQVDGDHFIPIMWRGRLRCYWLVFAKDSVQNAGAKTRSKQDYVTPASTRWKLTLAWSEYKNGKWTAKQQSREALYSFPIEEENVTSLEHLAYMKDRENQGLEVRAWYPQGTADKQVRERFYFSASVDGDGNINFNVCEKIVRNSSPRLSGNFYQKKFPAINNITIGVFTPSSAAPPSPPSPPYIYSDKWIDQALPLLDKEETWNDMFPIDTGKFLIQFNGVNAVAGGGLAMLSHYMPFTMFPPSYSWGYAPGTLESKGYRNAGTDFHYNPGSYIWSTLGMGNTGYKHAPDYDLSLLGYAPDVRDGKPTGKYLVFPRQLPENYSAGSRLEIPYFFYKDYDNTFFVEKVLEATNFFTAWSWNGNVVYKGSASSGGAFTLAKPFLVKYRFHNFRHDRVNDFKKQLFENGLDGLLDRDFIYNIYDTLGFGGNYQPTQNVLQRSGHYFDIPRNSIVFEYDNPYSAYNWELFYHIPMLIANKLSQNLQFEAARKWYQYVFNPTVKNNGNVAEFWNFQPFYDQAVSGVPTITQIIQSTGLQSAVTAWANDPFKPHLVARTRISAYMKNTVMKYLDNLIAWGDNLFRTESRENIVEATLMYVLAAQLLGRKPIDIPARATPVVQTYAMMEYGGSTSSLNAFGNALVKMESIMYASGVTTGTVNLPAGTTTPMYYFCIPPNDKLYGYWDIVADRLFKIRNCRNIDGVERELALFDPPIDPALLVKAAAAGISAADAVAAANAPLPLYRFGTMSQKATELANEVKSLGGQLLSALEKKDAEHLSLLRSTQEQKVLDAVTAVKEQAIEEAVTQINGLQQQQIMTTQKRDHYQSLIDGGLNDSEQSQLDSLNSSIPLAISKGITQVLASGMFAFPEVHVGAFNFGIRFGGANLGNLNNVAAAILDTESGINATKGSIAGIKAGYARRREDWDFQIKLAETELKQIDKQIIAAQIRQAMAEKELSNHKLQIQNAQELDTAMRDKYTNEDLYDWMSGQIAMSYFAAYKLAYDVAKKAERCYQNELNLPTASFIGYEYWDSLHKGLLAGEQLCYDIKRMEVSYLEKNKRQLELTKHISLASLNPEKLLELKTGTKCTVDIPEWLFDLDYPGQHMRRIKSVSVSIPCVAGPYTAISCKLSLLKSRYRKAATLSGYSYPELSTGGDPRFEYIYGPIQSIATSHAQNDSGMFDFSFRDERYLPFEGAGAISQWRIELPSVCAQFDYDSISDVILHINYTALDEGGLTDAGTYVTSMMKAATNTTDGFYRLFDLKHEFPNEWQQLLYGSSHAMILQKLSDRLPYLIKAAGSTDVADVKIYVQSPKNNLAIRMKNGSGGSYTTYNAGSTSVGNDWWLYAPAATASYSFSNEWYLQADRTVSATTSAATAADVANVVLVVHYKVH